MLLVFLVILRVLESVPLSDGTSRWSQHVWPVTQFRATCIVAQHYFANWFGCADAIIIHHCHYQLNFLRTKNQPKTWRKPVDVNKNIKIVTLRKHPRKAMFQEGKVQKKVHNMCVYNGGGGVSNHDSAIMGFFLKMYYSVYEVCLMLIPCSSLRNSVMSSLDASQPARSASPGWLWVSCVLCSCVT